MPLKLRGDLKAMLGAAVGAGVGLAGYFGTDYVWWLDAGIGAAATTLVFILVPRRKEDAEIEVAAGVTLAQLKDAVARTRGSGLKLIELAPRIPDAELGSAIAAIGRTLVAIAQCFEQEPGDVRRAYDLLDYHLRRGWETVATYAKLACAAEITPRERQRLDSFGAVIEELRMLFQEHLESIRGADFERLQQAGEAMRVIALKLERPRTGAAELAAPAAPTGSPS
jgi:hypothetical protein